MNKRLLAVPLVIALCAFIVVNLAMEKWHNRLLTTQKLNRITAPSSANVVLVGNSLLDGYVDPKTFSEVAQSESKDLHVIDAALLGSGPPVQSLLFQQAEKSHPLKTVVIGFMDFQLTVTDTTHPMDILGSSVIVFDKRVSVSDAANAYNFGMLDRTAKHTIVVNMVNRLNITISSLFLATRFWCSRICIQIGSSTEAGAVSRSSFDYLNHDEPVLHLPRNMRVQSAA